MVARFGSNHNAALLLMQVRMIAIGEVREASPSPTAHLSSPSLISFAEDPPSDSFEPSNPTTEQIRKGPRKPRCRTVSLCSQDELKRTSPTPTMFQSKGMPFLVEPDSPSQDTSDRILSESTRKPTSATPLPCNPSHKFVGNDVEGPIKATLRKKFSWKSHPELEAFLVENRKQYMQYSSQLNYTAEQKRYNNTLTQGLLEVASREGYRFEGFTFAAIRDRIRCYYKSYVQASKKRKRRKS